MTSVITTFYDNNAALFSFLRDEKLTDITLTAEGKMIRAHKVILAASSKYFEELFVLLEQKHPVIVLKDISMKNLLLLLEYAYLGSVNLPTEDVAEFKEAAKSLQFNIEFEEPFVQDMSQDLLTQVTANDQDMNSQYSDDTIEPASFEDMEYSAILTQKAGNGRELENIDNIVKGPSAKRRKREVSCTVTKKSQCNFCHRLMRERDRNYHQKFCWKNVDRIKSNCALCPKKFLVPGKLKMHMNHSHPDIL